LLESTLGRSGTPYQQITDVAKELNMDLIVISTHGYTGLMHVLMGSTAERIVRHAPCPVLTVRSR
jgi:nucleotide-binding universal stress UspA family protein